MSKNQTYLLHLICYTAFVFAMSSCKKPDSHPELKDPIYQDLSAQLKASNSAMAAAEKKIEETRAEIEKMEPRDPFKSRKLRELQAAQRQLVGLNEQAQYYKIRTQQRLRFTRTEYLKAFHADKPWPPPGEFDRYKQTKSLRQASRNWDDRVPRPKKAPASITGTKGKEDTKPGH